MGSKTVVETVGYYLSLLEYYYIYYNLFIYLSMGVIKLLVKLQSLYPSML